MKAARILSVVVLALVTSGAAYAAPIANSKAHRLQGPERSKIIDLSATIDINNILMFVTNEGSFAFDKGTGNSGLEFPIGTGKTAVFAAGLWIGARVAGTTRVAVAEYSDEFQGGSIIAGVPDDPLLAKYKVYKLNRSYTDTAVRDAVLADYNAGAVPHGAPVVTVQPDGTLDILGDQMLWAVYNDANPAKHTNRAGTTAPLGVEVQQTTFAFNRQGALGNTIFIKYKFINKGASTLDSMFVSQWSDPDLGGFTDDLVGCDTTLSLGYIYNATNNDEQYADKPPAVGYDFFQGPVNTLGDTLGLASFNKYINGTDPNTFAKTFNYMKGLDADGNVVINPVTGQPTNFQVSGDPVTGSGWLDTNPADRRLMLSSGPFRMLPGESQEVVAAIVIGQSEIGNSRLGAISKMKFFDRAAQAAFDANFDLPTPPSAPIVTVTPRDGAVFLSWDVSAENYNEPPYAFEGYVIYQGASIAGPFRRVATFDIPNGTTTVLDDDFNEEQGLILPTGKAFGTDVGVKYQIEIDEDLIRGGPLFNGQIYYYSVNAYAVGIGEFPQVLESAFNVLTVTPQTPAGGVDLSSASVSAVNQQQVTPGPQATTDVVTVNTPDPDKVIDASWEVGFKPACATCTNMVWYLVRTVGTAVDTVVNNWPNFAENENFPVVDGIQVKIVSYPPGELARITYQDTTGGNPAALHGDNVGLRFFDGGGDYANLLFGSAIPEFSAGPNITIRFGPPGQLGYRYLRCNCAPRTYLIQDFVPVPFTVWDTDNNRQLNVRWLENEPGSIDNGVWDPDDSGDGQRELVWPDSTGYTGVVDSTFFNDPDLQDVLSANLPHWYVIWPSRTSAGATIDEGDKILFTTSIPATPNDQFTFSTTAANRNVVALAKSEMDLIKAVPNPYFNRSSYELTVFNRVVKFTHLPARCTIRLFNLAGDLIRTIEKNDGTSQAVWDLETTNGLPVGSGIYIFHVDAPGIGNHVGKVAIFMEKERLNNF